MSYEPTFVRTFYINFYLWSERSSPKKLRGQDHASLDQTLDVIDSGKPLKIFSKKKINYNLQDYNLQYFTILQGFEYYEARFTFADTAFNLLYIIWGSSDTFTMHFYVITK